MSKKKKRAAGKAKGHSKSSGKNGPVNAGTAAIAKAERKLENTLNKLEDVRAELAEREATLRDLLVRHGRMPAETVAMSSEGQLDQSQATRPLGDIDGSDLGIEGNVASMPLLDQRQVLDVGYREPVDREG